MEKKDSTVSTNKDNYELIYERENIIVNKH